MRKGRITLMLSILGLGVLAGSCSRAREPMARVPAEQLPQVLAELADELDRGLASAEIERILAAARSGAGSFRFVFSLPQAAWRNRSMRGLQLELYSRPGGDVELHLRDTSRARVQRRLVRELEEAVRQRLAAP